MKRGRGRETQAKGEDRGGYMGDEEQLYLDLRSGIWERIEDIIKQRMIR